MINLICCLAFAGDRLKSEFVSPPDSARPGVYWYFMEGNISRNGITNDLEAMKQAGLGGGIFLEVDLGLPRGPVRYMSDEWRQLLGHAVKTADRLGLEINLGTGPGWCGTGGSWVTPDHAMQDLVSSEMTVTGPNAFSDILPKPLPRTPFFGMGSMTPELQKLWESYYRDEAVLAFPTPFGNAKLSDLDEKSLVYRPPYSSQPGVKATLRPDTALKGGMAISGSQIIDLTSHFTEGKLTWTVPQGKWTIVRFGRTLTGQTSRPAPARGLGFETDKFETSGITDHLNQFLDSIVKVTGPNKTPGRGLTSLHFDSWEMGSQNWSQHFRSEFLARRGYDPLKYLPVMTGKVVDSPEVSERFLWDLRQTAQELVVANHMGTIRSRAKKYGLGLSIEPYDMNPTADLYLGGAATVPMCEFWSKGYGYDTNYSCFEAVSVAHTNGRSIIGAESFTSTDSDAWLQHPGSMKAQADWALATGINKILFHRYQHQPNENQFPGMTMGPYGVHWERTQTWWDMVKPFHEYLTRSQNLLRQGLPVADILYLVPEGAPNVFRAPTDATIGDLPDRRSYNFDACDPSRLIEAATVKDGRIVFPDGMSYRLLVLPRIESMTPRLLEKLAALVKAGAAIQGVKPLKSPSLVQFPACDRKVQALADEMWRDSGVRKQYGKGQIFPDAAPGLKNVSLENAKWIWTDEGNPAVSAYLASRTFRKSFTMPVGEKLVGATVAFSADNTFVLRLNRRVILRGTDFNSVQVTDVSQMLESDNTLEVTATNTGNVPNPAGLIGVVDLAFANGKHIQIVTDGTWKPSGHKVQVLGDWNMAPWHLTDGSVPPPPMYPSYTSSTQILRNALHVLPDFESGDCLRYNHRNIGGRDAYFVSNRWDVAFTGIASLRVSHGTPEWWDPKTGESRPLPQFKQGKEITSIPLNLKVNQSGFIVFKNGLTESQGVNFPSQRTLTELKGPWVVSFEKRFGGLPSVLFPDLMDWTKFTNPDIRYFSGKAIYKKSFDLPSLPKRGLAVDLGDVKNIASVRLNGTGLGVAWCAPWQLNIPTGILHLRGNRIEVTVANLWPNRLIRDSGLPPEKRLTQTSWSPYRPNSPLLPSGLLGPVHILSQ